jgi:hypothetical protein
MVKLEHLMDLACFAQAIRRGVRMTPSIALPEKPNHRHRYQVGAAATTIASVWFGGNVTTKFRSNVQSRSYADS